MQNIFVKTHIFRGQKRTEECLANLENSKTPADIYVNSFCYLCYRVVDGSLEQGLNDFVSLKLFESFGTVHKRLNEISCEAARARWYSSLIMAYCYVYTQLKEFDEYIFNLVFDFVKKDTTRLWRNSIVNVMMCRLACVTHMVKIKNYTEANSLIAESDEVYKKTLVDLDTKSFFDTFFEISDATNLYFCIVLFGKISGYPLIYQVDKIFARLIHQQLHNPYNSLDSYYRLICSIIPELRVTTGNYESSAFTSKYITVEGLKDFLLI